MLLGIGAVHTYYEDAPPDQATLDMIAAQGGTVQYVDRATQYTTAYNTSGESVPVSGYTVPTTSPWPTGADIPVPPQPNYEQCNPRDTACVNRNTAREAEWGDILMLAYSRALNENANPGAGIAYQAMLAKYVGAGGTASGAVPVSGANYVAPTYRTPVTQPTTSAPSAQELNLTMAGPDPFVQPTVSTGGQAVSVSSKPSTASSGIPSWAILGALGIGAFLVLKGNK